jgi:hypothetical protein
MEMAIGEGGRQRVLSGKRATVPASTSPGDARESSSPSRRRAGRGAVRTADIDCPRAARLTYS